MPSNAGERGERGSRKNTMAIILIMIARAGLAVQRSLTKGKQSDWRSIVVSFGPDIVLLVGQLLTLIPNPPLWVGKPSVHLAVRQVQDQLPESQMLGAQLRASSLNQPVPQLRVREAPPQPAQRVPVADREDAGNDQIAVGGPAQAGEVRSPRRMAARGAEAWHLRRGIVAVFS